MPKNKTIKVGNRSIQAYFFPLQTKNLIFFKGSKGYIMCGYLNLAVSRKFNDVAAKIIGVSSIEDALKAKIHSCTVPARRLGIKPGQPVKEALGIIA